jgi:hypothetical protein
MINGAGFANISVVHVDGLSSEACVVGTQTPVGDAPADPVSTTVVIGVSNDPNECG